MNNIAVATTPTQVLSEENRSGQEFIVQNQGDVQMRIAFGENVTLLSQTLGIALDPGDSMSISGSSASKRVFACHVGVSGTKTIHIQRI